MRGVILAGGTGTRLLPMTRVTNKHLLPCWDRPMIMWPLQILLDNDIRDIMVITGREHAGHVFGLLGSGAAFGCEFTFRVQDEAGGIAQALFLAHDFVIDDGVGDCAVVLGDTIMLPSPVFGHFPSPGKYPGPYALVYLQEVEHPDAYGVVEWAPKYHEGDAQIRRIHEKPESPQSRYAVTGLYLYDANVFDYIHAAQPSARGELEITDVNNAYAGYDSLDWRHVPGYWGDMGTIEGLHDAAVHAKAVHEQQQRVVAISEPPDWRRDGPPSNAPVGG